MMKKIVYFGFDYFHNCLQRLISEGYHVEIVYTFEVDGVYNFNELLKQHARNAGIKIVEIRSASEIDWKDLKKRGVNLAISAGFPFRLPSESENEIRGINIHPSLLPEGRGAWPIPNYLIENKQKFGVTIHKISEVFDAGEILIQWAGAITDTDDYDTLSARIQIAAGRLLISLLKNFEGLWSSAVPQLGGEYWAKPTDEEQNLDFTGTVEQGLKLSQAYGSAGVGAVLEEGEYVCSQVGGWVECHSHRYGEIVHRTNSQIIVAVANGFLLIRNIKSV